MDENECDERVARLEDLVEGHHAKPMHLAAAAEYMGLKRSTLYKLTSGADVPHYKPNGKRIYFLRGDLDNWLLRHRMRAIEEIVAGAKFEKE